MNIPDVKQIFLGRIKIGHRRYPNTLCNTTIEFCLWLQIICYSVSDPASKQAAFGNWWALTQQLSTVTRASLLTRST